jgi:hypothetical protein
MTMTVLEAFDVLQQVFGDHGPMGHDRKAQEAWVDFSNDHTRLETRLEEISADLKRTEEELLEERGDEGCDRCGCTDFEDGCACLCHVPELDEEEG